MKPNMMATLRCRDFSAPAALVVPAIVVKNDMAGTYLYVLEREKGNAVARKLYITTGLTEGNRTMVVAGLAAGQSVIVNGYNLVRNGLPVTVGQ
jgi:multidrug efflux system membrane fusion protein